MNSSLEILPSIATVDGQIVVTYTPILKGGILATGQLEFARWQCLLLAGPEEHERTIANARRNAWDALLTIQREVTR